MPESRGLIVNGYRIDRTPSAVVVTDSRGGTRYSIPRKAGALRRACAFARVQREG